MHPVSLASLLLRRKQMYTNKAVLSFAFPVVHDSGVVIVFESMSLSSFYRLWLENKKTWYSETCNSFKTLLYLFCLVLVYDLLSDLRLHTSWLFTLRLVKNCILTDILRPSSSVGIHYLLFCAARKIYSNSLKLAFKCLEHVTVKDNDVAIHLSTLHLYLFYTTNLLHLA